MPAMGWRSFTIGFVFSWCAFAPASSIDLPSAKQSPFCSNALDLLSNKQAAQIIENDRELRELTILQQLGPNALGRIMAKTGYRPFEKIKSEEQALELVENMISRLDFYRPPLEEMAKLSPSQRWVVYLNSGYQAVCACTPDHRWMNKYSVDQLPLLGREGNPARYFDMGLGVGNMGVTMMAKNPKAIYHSLDVAGGSLNAGVARLNAFADAVNLKFEDPFSESTGRWNVQRGSGTDPSAFSGHKYDGATTVLTLFTIPTLKRKDVLRQIYDRLLPGAKFVLIDPLPTLNDPLVGRQYLRDITQAVYRQNEDVTAFDLVMLATTNAHNLLKTDFLTGPQQQKMGESVGFEVVEGATPVYYGIAAMTVFQKPFNVRE